MQQPAGKVVVTGGAGFIGSHLVDRLLAESRAEIVVIDDLSRGRLENLLGYHGERRMRFVQGDVRDAGAVDDVLQGASIVYHLAARSNVIEGMDDIESTFSTNVVGTFNVLRAAARHSVVRLIFASSREAYGEPVALPVDEGHPLFAISSYGASKVAGEAYCRAFRRSLGLQTIILRLANVYGARDFGRMIPSWLERAATGQDLHVYGGKQIVDFVWVGQVVEALVRAGAMEEPLPVINVASGTGTRVIDLAQRIAHLVGGHGQVRLLPARPAEVTPFVANIDRMRQMLKIEPTLDPLAHLPSLVAPPITPAGSPDERPRQARTQAQGVSVPERNGARLAGRSVRSVHQAPPPSVERSV